MRRPHQAQITDVPAGIPFSSHLPLCKITSTTKARSLPRPWPLLRNGQDPSDLAARVAFHLHRLNLTGKSLINTEAGVTRDIAADLAGARRPLTQHAVNELAAGLRVELAELSRDLTIDEQREWFFYRVSARYPRDVWTNAHAAWNKAGWSIRAASRTMQLHHSYVLRQIHPGRAHPSPLLFPPAVRLSTALSIPQGPNIFLPEPYRSQIPELTVTR